MRLIDLDELLKKGYPTIYHTEYGDEVVNVEDLKNMPTIERRDKWIPVSKKLPIENGYYITSTMYNEVYCDYWNGVNFDRTETVIAWQYLPKHY